MKADDNIFTFIYFLNNLRRKLARSNFNNII